MPPPKFTGGAWTVLELSVVLAITWQMPLRVVCHMRNVRGCGRLFPPSRWFHCQDWQGEAPAIQPQGNLAYVRHLHEHIVCRKIHSRLLNKDGEYPVLEKGYALLLGKL